MKSSLVNVVVLVLLSPHLVLDFSPDRIQRTVTVAVPWLQGIAATLTILKYGTDFLNKKDLDGSDGGLDR